MRLWLQALLIVALGSFLSAPSLGQTATPDPHSPDLSSSGMVDPLDLFLLASHWNEVTGPAPVVAGDFEGNGRCGPEDLITFLDLWDARIPVIASNTVVIDSQPDLHLISLSTGEVLFDDGGAGNPGIDIGDIIVGSASGGYLRRVQAVNVIGNKLILSTTGASLAEAVEQGFLSSRLALVPGATMGVILPKSGDIEKLNLPPVSASLNQLVLYDQSGLKLEIPSGEISLSSALDQDLGIHHFRLERYSLVLGGNLNLDLRVLAMAESGAAINPELAVAHFQWFFYQVIGLLPVVEVVTLDFVAGAKFETGARGSVQTSVRSNFSFQAGAEYRGGQWRNLSSARNESQWNQPIWSADGSLLARVYVEPRLKVEIYESAGPSIGLQPFLQFDADVSNKLSCSWMLSTGMDANLDFRIGILDHTIKDWPETSSLVEEDLASGSCPPTHDIITIDLPNLPPGARPLRLVRIPAGTFQMGSPNTERGRESDEGPVHTVTITHDFYMGETEVTQAQWKALMGLNPTTDLGYTPYGVGNDYPVYYVSWNDCQSLITALNGLPEQSGYRLPTEAEWEYACRAGTSTRFSFGDNLSCDDTCGACSLANQYMVSCGNGQGRSEAVGSPRLPNAFGLYDMHGNVFEWCRDWYQRDFYIQPGATDPNPLCTNSTSGFRVTKGSYWGGYATYCRSALRGGFYPTSRYGSNGLRVVRFP